MADSVDSYVADNSQRLRDVDSRFVEVDSNRNRDLSFGANFYTVSVDIEVYTRSTGTQVIFGHPDASKGFGRGTFGDDKREWVLETDVTATAEFTRDGRKAAAEALNGQTGAVVDGAIGSDSSAAATNDTALGAELARSTVLGKRTSNVLDTVAKYDATTVAGDPPEYGIFDGAGRLLARVTVDTSSISVASTDELRAIVTLTFDGDGNGKAVVTSDGEDALAASIESPDNTVGPQEYAFGDGSTDFSKSDTSLTSELFRNTAGRESGRDRIRAYTRVTDADMSSVSTDISEVGLFDNSGRMIWATTILPIASDSSGFNVDTTIVVV